MDIRSTKFHSRLQIHQRKSHGWKLRQDGHQPKELKKNQRCNRQNIHSLPNILKAYCANVHQDKPRPANTVGTDSLKLSIDTRQALGTRPTYEDQNHAETHGGGRRRHRVGGGGGYWRATPKWLFRPNWLHAGRCKGAALSMTERSASKAEGSARYASKVNAWRSGNPSRKRHIPSKESIIAVNDYS